MATIFEDQRPYDRRLVNHVRDAFYGDYMMRMAFVEYLESIDADFDPWQTLLEATLFPAKIGEALGDELWDTSRSIDSNSEIIAERVGFLIGAIRENLAIPDLGYDEVYLLSLGDQELVLNAVKSFTKKEWATLKYVQDAEEWDYFVAPLAKAAKALSEHVTVDVLEGGVDITLIQGSHGSKKYSRKINKKSGKFYITRNGIDQFGLTIPIHAFPPGTDPIINIEYPKPAKDISIIVTGAPDSTKLELKRGKTSKQRSLSANDLRTNIWTFSVDVKTTED